MHTPVRLLTTTTAQVAFRVTGYAVLYCFGAVSLVCYISSSPTFSLLIRSEPVQTKPNVDICRTSQKTNIHQEVATIAQRASQSWPPSSCGNDLGLWAENEGRSQQSHWCSSIVSISSFNSSIKGYRTILPQMCFKAIAHLIFVKAFFWGPTRVTRCQFVPFSVVGTSWIQMARQDH